MRRYVFLLPLFVALALPVPANEQRDSVSIAVVRDARPAVFVGDDGRPAGIFPDLLRRLLADIGRDPEFVTGHTLSTAFEAVQRGEVDLLLAVLKNPERERVLDFNTEPV
ncbi:MAG: transporter substrate-binding domain-containing protein, partial [Spirochaetota bacterium]